MMTWKIKGLDITVAVAYLVMLASKMLSVMSMVRVQEFTKAGIESVYTAYEANIFFKAALLMGQTGFLLHAVVLPGLLIAYYAYLRRKGADEDILTFYVVFALASLLSMIANDLGSYLGIIAK